MKFFLFFQFLFLFFYSISQDNDFKIGIYGVNVKTYFDTNCGSNIEYSTPIGNDGFNTSQLNVYVEDGFNIVQSYQPNEWTKLEGHKNVLSLCNNLGLKILVGGGNYYKPTYVTGVTCYGGVCGVKTIGVNTYDNCQNSISDCESPKSNGYFRSDITHYLNTVYTHPQFKDIVWGFQMAEEPEHYHPAFYDSDCFCNTCTWQDPPPLNDPHLYYTEVPPSNIGLAFDYYNNILFNNGVFNKNLVFLNANHGKMINSNASDPEGQYNSDDYIQQLKYKTNSVFFEGSYIAFPDGTGGYWYDQHYNDMFSNGYHYLAGIKSIDHTKGNLPNVHNVIAIYGNKRHIHSNMSLQNANFLWFKTYTSIIHGVDGVWFWWQSSSAFLDGEINNWYNPSNPLQPDRFHRQNFPYHYRNFVSYLARELRYLKEEGFLDLEPSKRLYTKLDHQDYYCIVPPALDVIPDYYLDAETNEGINLNGNIFGAENFRTEAYNLRYTIKTNNDEVIMIITNPLPVPLVNVELDFSQIPNPRISMSDGVWVLFEDHYVLPSATNYKINRNANVNWQNHTVGNKFFETMTNKKINLSFGPLDTKVIKFEGGVPISSNSNSLHWSKIFSTNYDNNKIVDWKVSELDYYVVGDFDGDGLEELFVIMPFNLIYNQPYKAALFKFNEATNDWTIIWSTNDNNHPILPYAGFGKLKAGDFDGDGKDELIGKDSWVTLFKFDGYDFNWFWSDYGNHDISPYRHNMTIGDFDGDGKDEVLGFDVNNNWGTMFNFENHDFNWGWSNYGMSSDLDPYKNKLISGDFNGDGKDELLGQASWLTIFQFNNGNWDWRWSDYGSGNVAGWATPLATDDILLVGNITNDNKDNILFVQNGQNSNASLLLTLNGDFNGWNQIWQVNYTNTPFFNDLPIEHPNSTSSKYFLIKSRNNKVKHLLDIRTFDICGSAGINKRIHFGMYYYGDKMNNVQEIKSDSNIFSVYPNPSNTHIILDIDKSISVNSTVYLYTLNGKLVKKLVYDGNQIDISDLERGMYILKMISLENVYSTNFVKL